jgi:hypothetical protein
MVVDVWSARASPRWLASFFSGVSHTTLSTPGVCLPRLVVTRFTATARPLHERTRIRCKARTLRFFCCCSAFTIRICNRRTFRSARRQLI